jgi:phytoene synthase
MVEPNGRAQWSSMSEPYRAPAESQRYVFDQVRRTDRDRFLGALFAPEPQRTDLLAILAFDHELARTRTVTREPMLAAIRLQWWREAVTEAAGSGKPRAHPLVESLSETLRRRQLPPEAFMALVDAREEGIEGALDVVRTGHVLADLELAVLGIDDESTRIAARAVAAAWLMGEGRERVEVLAEARGLRPEIDAAALPILLPALSLGGTPPWLHPLTYWWAARRGRY